MLTTTILNEALMVKQYEREIKMFVERKSTGKSKMP